MAGPFGRIPLSDFSTLFLMVTMSGTAQATSNDTLRVAHPSQVAGVKSLDPASIVYSSEYGVLENVLSPLVEMEPDGQLTSGLADSLEWKGDALHLHIRQNARTATGMPITADDAAFSLKRLLVLGQNTHGRLGEIICPGHRLTSITDECPGISVDGQRLVLKAATAKPFLVPMLTAIDFGVLTRSSVDPGTLAITSLKNTSGPYYVDDVKPDGSFVLKANPNHWHYRRDIPQIAVYVPADQSLSGEFPAPFEQFRRKLVDFIPSSSVLGKHRFVDYTAIDPVARINATLNVSRTLLVFTPRGLAELDEHTRFAIGEAIRRAFWEKAASERHNRLPARQWFAEQGEGNLSQAQLKELDQAFTSAPAGTSGKGLSLSVFPMQLAETQRVLSNVLPGMAIDANLGEFLKAQADGPVNHSTDPHMIILTTDGMWNENIAFVSYSLSLNLYPLSRADADRWLTEFMSTEDKNERLTRLRNLHFLALRTPKVVSLLSEPQYSMVRAPWTQESCPIFSSSALWRIHSH